MEKLPIMTFYVSDFLGSSRVQELGGDDRGLYLCLLVHEWNFQGKGLPIDGGSLARLLGVGDERFSSAWKALSTFFFERSGRLFNHRLEVELKKACHNRNEAKRKGERGGRASAQARLKPRLNPSSTPAQAEGVLGGNHRAVGVGDGDGDGSSGCIEEGMQGEGQPKPELDPIVHRGQPTDAEAVEEWLHRACHFGSVKARKVLALGVTMADVRAWQEFERLNGTSAMIGAIQGARNPRDLPRGVSGASGSPHDRERQAIQRLKESGQGLLG